MYSAKIFGYQMDSAFGEGYELYLPEYKIPSPELRSNFVEIDGMDGFLNLSSVDGNVSYKPVSLALRFESISEVSDEAHQALYATKVRGAILGKEGNIIFDDDLSYYYHGVVTSVDVSCEKNAKIVVVVNLFLNPYKYYINETVVERSVHISDTIALVNDVIPVVPVIGVFDTEDSVNIQYTIGSSTYNVSVNAGWQIIDTLVLHEGVTNVSVDSSTEDDFTFKVKYRQGRF